MARRSDRRIVRRRRCAKLAKMNGPHMFKQLALRSLSHPVTVHCDANETGLDKSNHSDYELQNISLHLMIQGVSIYWSFMDSNSGPGIGEGTY